MGKRVSYKHIKYFNEYLNGMKRRRMDFLLTKTTYSRKITDEDSVVVFNDRGMDDNKTLHLLNRVRSDAKNWRFENGKLVNQHIDFFKLFNNPRRSKVMCKIDVNSAYWTYAIQKGIVSQETDDLYREYFKGVDSKTAKQARLKALGSLATKKLLIPYVNGKPDYDNEQINVQETRDIYMSICAGIDNLMKDAQKKIEGCYYYYWDCVFVESSFSRESVDFFLEKGYDVTTDETKIEVVKVKDNYYLITTTDGTMYMTRKEDKHLLEDPF